jgi:hypothetical protein
MITEAEKAELEYLKVHKRILELEEETSELETLRDELVIKFIELRMKELEKK